ncbi:LuxR C-terminal-related transcriptional regulator [Nocardia vinacea]|uniref:LuxR C-terminal-related transcriptional regulator n=1 Tax=Nocardia vinacea TaxID=96468 RepID=A0ABZ1YTS8_9NOCA|nr:LuxR C-terminal-related transcriptional regulator [Nocardia vinacea]
MGAAPGELPVGMTSFVGRCQELTEVRKLLAAARLVTLAGVGGVGKTRLALELAAESRKAFADGVCVIDLGQIHDPELVAHAAVDALGMRGQSNNSIEQQLVEYLGGKHLLIVVDNCEHLVDACAALADRLLRQCAWLRILATSRQQLGIDGEHVYVVLPLPVPDPARPPPLHALAQYESVKLLVDRAKAVQPEFRLSEENRAAVTRLCARLDGLPLAIELAASRLRALPVAAVACRLEERFHLLTGGSRAAPHRQRTLQATIDWSYELCSPEERRLWNRLSVFAGGFDLTAAEGVCADDRLPRHTVPNMIGRLVDRSVVLVTGSDNWPRYGMLETFREYGWQRLVEAGEDGHIRLRHRDFFVSLTQRVADALTGPGQEEALARLRAEHGNLRVALRCATDDPMASQPTCALATALCYTSAAGGFLSAGRRWLDRVVGAAPEPTMARAHALWVAGWATLLLGDFVMVEARLSECAALAAELGATVTHARAISLRGTLAHCQGRPTEAVARFEQAITELTQAGDHHGVLMSLSQLAAAQACAGDERASATARQAISMSEQRGERLCRSYALWSLGLHSWLQGDLPTAATVTRQGLEIQRGFDDHVGAALMIELLAWIAAAQRDLRYAARLLGAAGSIWRAIGSAISVFGPHLDENHLRCEHAVARGLRAAAFQAALADGAQLDLVQAIACALGGPAAETAEPPGEPVLTTREREVATLIMRGMTNRMVAETLVISRRTVDRHVERIFAKLGFNSRAQVAAWIAERQRHILG